MDSAAYLALGRLRSLLLLVLLLCAGGLLITLGGCAGFRSVVATASIGQMVGSRAAAATMMPFYCEAENTLASPEVTCPRDKVELYAKEVVKYAQGLSGYAVALRNLAESDDARAGDRLSLLLAGGWPVASAVLPAVDATSISMSAAAFNLGSTLSQEWRRHKLEILIVAAHPHVVTVVEGLLGRVALLSESARDMAERSVRFRRRNIEELERNLPPGTHLSERQLHQAIRLALLQFEFLLHQGYDNLVGFGKALSAFRQAHEILYNSIRSEKGLRNNDQEIYDLLKNGVSEF